MDLRRFTAAFPCPICGGHDGLRRGQERRCYGYLDSTGDYARCTREELAGGLPQNQDGTYSHRTEGPCRCGVTHIYKPTPNEPKSWSSGNGSHEPTTVYVIRDRDGTELARHCRRGTGKDKHVWWHGGLDGAHPADWLYGAELLEEWRNEAIFVTEGEKAADALRALGLPALGTVTGASSAISESAAELLRGRCVYLWPDADEQGHQHMVANARMLAAAGAEVEFIRWPNAPPSGDAADLVARWPDGAKNLIDRLCLESEPWMAGPELAESEPPSLIFQTAEEIRNETPEHVDWVWEGYVARGALTMVASKPKAGKSTLIFGLVRAMVDDASEFAGRTLNAGSVVYLSEEGGPTLRPKLDFISGPRLVIAKRQFPVPDLAESIRATIAKAEEIGASLIIVDTLTFWAKTAADAEKDPGAMAAVLALFAEATTKGFAVVLVHHNRKGGGDDGEGVRGSTAILAAVDILVELDRVKDGKKTERLLLALSRWDETPQALIVDRSVANDGSYAKQVEGDRDDVEASAARMRLLEALPAEGDGVSASDLAEDLGITRRAVAKHLAAMLGSTVEKVGSGVRGDAFRYLRKLEPESWNPTSSRKESGFQKDPGSGVLVSGTFYSARRGGIESRNQNPPGGEKVESGTDSDEGFQFQSREVDAGELERWDQLAADDWEE